MIGRLEDRRKASERRGLRISRGKWMITSMILEKENTERI